MQLECGCLNIYELQQFREYKEVGVRSMKSTSLKGDRKIKSAVPSKKNSTITNSIYKQIITQIQQLSQKHQNEKNKKPPKKTNHDKYSLGNIKKKSSIISIPFQQPPSIIPTNTPPSLHRKLFKYHYIIGKGGFGKVWRVQHLKSRNLFAMKQMLKSLVMSKKSVQSVMNERVLLADLNSPFLVNMHFAFQDRDALYLVLDLMEGGDLRYHIGNRSFNQVQSKFFIGCIILGLEYLHNNKIIHRDLKPQNLVLDSRGYIRITDLGISRTYRHNNSTDTSGTPGYMSPQVICRQNHTVVSDYFSLGVIAYELMSGKRPYQGRSRNQIRDEMLAKQVQIKNAEVPVDWTYESADFINKLIQRKAQNRLGYKGIQEIKSHPWIKDLNWKKLYNKQIQSPFIPLMKKSNFDQDDQITIEDQQEAQLIEKNSLLLRKPQFQELFKNYYFDTFHQKERTKSNFFNNSQRPDKDPEKIQTKKSVQATIIRNSKDISIKKYIDTLQTTSKDKNNRRKYSGGYFQQKSFSRQHKN